MEASDKRQESKIRMHKITHKKVTEGHVIFSWYLGESMPWPHGWVSEAKNGGWRGVVRKSESGMKRTIAT
jgi:hypothetical protein